MREVLAYGCDTRNNEVIQDERSGNATKPWTVFAFEGGGVYGVGDNESDP